MAYGPFNNQLLRTTILLINEELIMLNNKGIAMKEMNLNINCIIYVSYNVSGVCIQMHTAVNGAPAAGGSAPIVKIWRNFGGSVPP